MPGLDAFIDGLPKVELHVHIEGSLDLEMLFALAERHGTLLPFATVEEVRRAYDFDSLQDFLDVYYQGMSVLRCEQDFYDLTAAYMARIAMQNVLHTDIFFDPQAHMSRGIAFQTMLSGITRALNDSERDLAITSKLIMCFLRHLSEEEAFATLKEAAPHKALITGADSIRPRTVTHPRNSSASLPRRGSMGLFLLPMLERKGHRRTSGKRSTCWRFGALITAIVRWRILT